MFPFRSYYHGVWSKADGLRLSVVMGLRRGLSLIHGMRHSLTEDEQHKVATAVVEHLAIGRDRTKSNARGTWAKPHVQVKLPAVGAQRNNLGGDVSWVLLQTSSG